jgi:hypothetical protein
MSALDAALGLLSDGPPDWNDDLRSWECALCSATAGPFADPEREADAAFSSFVHRDGCAWASLPQIIAVLEAAEDVAHRWRADIDGRGDEPVPPHVRLAHLGPLFRRLDALLAQLEA